MVHDSVNKKNGSYMKYLKVPPVLTLGNISSKNCFYWYLMVVSISACHFGTF
jgi:hypothetical protein